MSQEVGAGVESDEKKRRRWTREETTGFLRCYLTRKSEFEHSKKKRVAYANVLEDMVSLGITDSERTPVCLESKMRTLLIAYKAARDNNRSTGASPCFAPYMELMDEIFGNTPIIKNEYGRICVGRRPFQKVFVDVSSPTPSPSAALPPLPSPSASEFSASPQSPASPAPSCSNSNSATNSSSASVGRKRRSARELYYDKKIELKKQEAEEKKKARSEAIQQFKEVVKESFGKEIQLEERKVALLEKIPERDQEN